MNFNYTNSSEFNSEDVEYKRVEISRHEWEHDNEMEISELWRSCLLFTSPSPREATLSRMPSSA